MKIGKKTTLRKQFLINSLSILFLIAIISGAIQLYFMEKQIETQTDQQAQAVASNVVRAIEETDLATSTIEHQIDLKLVAYSKHIAELIKDKTKDEITNAELLEIRDQLGVAGITIFEKTEEDIVSFAATEKEEIGFSFKEAGMFEVIMGMLQEDKPQLVGATHTDKNLAVLPISQSATHKDKPTFFKYAYYYIENTPYIINPYIEANEVNAFIEQVGPKSTINKLVEKYDVVEEIAVLNPKVFADPSLEEQLYPPLKKIAEGQFTLKTDQDVTMLRSGNIKQQSFIESIDGDKFYKMFLPIDDDNVIYIALDYGKMSSTLYRHSIILIVAGLLSLIVLFLLTARYFNTIYENIQKIIDQIKLLEGGDLTAKSKITDGNELEQLSQSTNHMVDKLNRLVSETQKQAENTQRLSLLLEAEASQSVEKMYALSTEATMKSREQLFVITDFLDSLTDVLHQYKDNRDVSAIIEKVKEMKQIAHERTAATTDTTITLSDLLQSLHGQSSDLSDISNSLLEQINKFKL